MLEQARVPYYGLPSQTEFPFFNPFQQFYRSADEFIMPPSSPNGSQVKKNNPRSIVDFFNPKHSNYVNNNNVCTKLHVADKQVGV